MQNLEAFILISCQHNIIHLLSNGLSITHLLTTLLSTPLSGLNYRETLSNT